MKYTHLISFIAAASILTNCGLAKGGAMEIAGPTPTTNPSVTLSDSPHDLDVNSSSIVDIAENTATNAPVASTDTSVTTGSSSTTSKAIDPTAVTPTVNSNTQKSPKDPLIGTQEDLSDSVEKELSESEKKIEAEAMEDVVVFGKGLFNPDSKNSETADEKTNPSESSQDDVVASKDPVKKENTSKTPSATDGSEKPSVEETKLPTQSPSSVKTEISKNEESVKPIDKKTTDKIDTNKVAVNDIKKPETGLKPIESEKIEKLPSANKSEKIDTATKNEKMPISDKRPIQKQPEDKNIKNELAVKPPREELSSKSNVRPLSPQYKQPQGIEDKSNVSEKLPTPTDTVIISSPFENKVEEKLEKPISNSEYSLVDFSKISAPEIKSADPITPIITKKDPQAEQNKGENIPNDDVQNGTTNQIPDDSENDICTDATAFNYSEDGVTPTGPCCPNSLVHQGDIDASTQADLENILAGKCAVMGNISFHDSPENADLRVLDKLVKISGKLSILNNASLVAVPLFENLREVKAIEINNNESLVEIKGFKNVIGIEEITIEISNNPTLKAIAGFKSLDVVSKLSISNNPALELIAGFDKLSLATVGIQIQENGLIDMKAFFSLAQIGEDFIVQDNAKLISLMSLKNISSIGGQLVFKGQTSICEILANKWASGIAVSGSVTLSDLKMCEEMDKEEAPQETDETSDPKMDPKSTVQ